MEGSVVRDPRSQGAAPRARATASDNGIARVLPVTSDPAPLGLAAFALTTAVLSIFNAHLVNGAGKPVVLGLALAYGGVAQLLAGMWEFRTGNTFGATAFTSFGAFWISFWAFNQFYAKEITNPTVLGHSIGLYLIAWGIFTAYMFVASLRVSAAVALVFILLAATFVVLGIGESNAAVNTIKIGGYLGLATAAAAFYASFAGVVNATFGRIIVPVIDLKRR